MSLSRQVWQTFIILFGTMLEWAEYTFYAYMAPTLAGIFFPIDAGTNLALLYTFGIFAVGFLMRPIGAIIFGHIGDTVGRKPALMLSMSLMSLATLGIGLCPSYAAVGMLAPILLTLCRLIQGVSIGGEYHGAGIYLVEQSKTNPHLSGAWVSVGAGIGTVIGALTATLVSNSTLTQAWRVPFIIGAGLYLVCYLFRQQLSETVTDSIQSTARKMSTVTIIRQYYQPFLSVMSISAMIGVTLYVCNIYFITHLMNASGLTQSTASSFAFWAQVLVVFLIPISAIFADWHNKAQQQFAFGSLFIAIAAPFMFWSTNGAFVHGPLIAIIIYAIAYSVVCGPMFKLLHDAFPAPLRYRGIGVAWNIAAVIFSGTALVVAQTLIVWLDSTIAPAFYVSACALFAFAFNHSAFSKQAKLIQ